MTSPSFPQGFPSPKTAPSVIGFPKKQKFRQAGQSPSRATFEKKNDKNRKVAPAVGSAVRESAITDPNEGRVPGRAPSGWGRALAKPLFRRNASAGRQAGLARRLSPAAARRAGRSRSRCGRAGAGAAEAPGQLERRSKRQGSPQPCGDPALRLWAWDRAGAIARVFRRKAPRRHP